MVFRADNKTNKGTSSESEHHVILEASNRKSEHITICEAIHRKSEHISIYRDYGASFHWQQACWRDQCWRVR